MPCLGRVLLFFVAVLLAFTFWRDRGAFNHLAVTATLGALVVYAIWRAVGGTILGKMVVAIFSLVFLAALLPK